MQLKDKVVIITGAALFLASDSSNFVTGTAMVIDGGFSVNKI